jgi:DNA-binding GntR family transcriptional regulator
VQELYGLAVEAALQVTQGPELDELTAALAAMRDATRVGERLDQAEAHRRFHVALVALAGNRQLSLVYESILVKIQLYMAMNLRREAQLAQPHDGVHRHERLYEAVLHGDRAAVLRELASHGARSYLD